MQESLVHKLQCPFSNQPLILTVIEKKLKQYNTQVIEEIWKGYLQSPIGLIFPIIEGVPRMLIESMFEHDAFLKEHIEDLDQIRNQFLRDHKKELDYCQSKNTRTKKAFSIEWSFLKPEKQDRVWHDDISSLIHVFEKETAVKKESLNNKIVYDIGAGHGLMTESIGKYAKEAVGLELSEAVLRAYKINKNPNVHYIQGDLQFHPFKAQNADILYSSGVIICTDNVYRSLQTMEPILKTKGRISLWLYHPQNNLFHLFWNSLRFITTLMPLWILVPFLMFLVLPLTYSIKKLNGKNKKLTWREEMIDLMDQFCPQYRHEVKHSQAQSWLRELGYENISNSTENNYGFTVIGDKA